MDREISEIMNEFIDDIKEDGNRFVLGEKAKSDVKEITENYGWRDERAIEYKAHIIAQAEKQECDPITVCVADMLGKLANAPTTLHMIAVIRLIMPVLWEFMQEERKDEK